MMLRAKQKGFTLLELLVVITLLAILSVGALVAYEGIGDTAQATAASNNTASADRAIRNFKAVTQNYPDQWDNLVVSGGVDEDGTTFAVGASGTVGALPTFEKASVMGNWLAAMPLVGTTRTEIGNAFEAVGIEEIQTRLINAATLNVEPNLQHNEGAVGNITDVAEVVLNTMDRIAIVPAYDGTGCTTTAGAYPTATLNATALGVANGNRLNIINDDLGSTDCNLVVALGFGHDAAHSTNGSSVAISTAPTFVSKDINPNEDYARYIALFHVGNDADEDGVIADAEIFDKARLISVVDTEGNTIDQNLAKATDQTAN